MVLRRASIALCAVALASPLGLAACGNKDKQQGVDEPAGEGLALPLDGVDYNVFITRELNVKIPPDDAYVKDEAPPGQVLYGVFLQVCNHSDASHMPASRFLIRDNQDNTFSPEQLPLDNQFAYNAREIGPNECIPEAGSVAQLGPTAGSMLLFQLPLENTENRPLELEIERNGEKRTFTLDI